MISKITFPNKTGIQNDEEVPENSKVTDSNMNEIKQVVNDNADELNTAKASIEQLQNNQGTSSENITDLKNRVNSLEKDNTNNKSNISNLQEGQTTQGQQIENLNEQYTQLNQGLQAANNQIGVLDSLKADRFETEKQFRKIYTDQERQDKLINGLKDSAINITTDKQKSLHIEDSSNMPAKINIFGNSEQEIRDGKNIFNKSSIPVSLSRATVEELDTGVKVNSSQDIDISYAKYVIKDMSDFVGKTIRMKSDFKNINNSTARYVLGFTNEDGTSSTLEKAYSSTSGQTISYTIEETDVDDDNCFLAILLYGNFGGSHKAGQATEYNNLIITIDNEDMSYEAFGETPSPKFPSPIKNAGSNINLLDFSVNETTVNGITPTNTKNGIILNGKCTADTWINFNFSNVSMKKGKYILSCKAKMNDGDISSNEDRIAIKINSTDKLVLFNTNETFDVNDGDIINSGYIRLFAGDTFDNVLLQCKFEEGDTATSYSPYNCGNIAVSVFNKNWADGNRLAEEMKEHSKTATEEVIDGKNCIVFNNNSFLYSSGFRGLKNNYKENTQYLIRANVRIKDTSVTSAYTLYIQAYDKSGNIIGSKGSEAKGTQWIELSFVTNENASLDCIGFSYGNAKEWVLDKDSIQIYEANMTEECPIYEGQKIVLPLLEGQRLMLGDYPGEDEKIHHVRNQVELDGTENWLSYSSQVEGYYKAYTNNKLNIKDFGVDTAMCSHFKINASNFGSPGNFIYCSPSYIYLSIQNDIASNSEELKAWLSGQKTAGMPVILESKLAEEEETEDFTEDQKTAFEQLQNADMYKPVTNITTEENMALIEANYIADTKTYIDNKYNNLAQQIINQITGGN